MGGFVEADGVCGSAHASHAAAANGASFCGGSGAAGDRDAVVARLAAANGAARWAISFGGASPDAAEDAYDEARKLIILADAAGQVWRPKWL